MYGEGDSPTAGPGVAVAAGEAGDVGGSFGPTDAAGLAVAGIALGPAAGALAVGVPAGAVEGGLGEVVAVALGEAAAGLVAAPGGNGGCAA